MHDVMDSPHRQRIVKEVVKEFADATERTVADEGQAEDQLAEPGLGNGEPEEELGRLGRGGGEGLREGVVGVGPLLVDELAANLVLVSQGSDGLAGQGG